MEQSQIFKRLRALFSCFLLCLVLILPLVLWAATDEKKEELRQDLTSQIDAIQQQIKEYQDKIKNNQSKAKSLKNEIQILEDSIAKIKLQISQIDLAIQESDLNISEIEKNIGEIESKVDKEKDVLAEYVRVVNQYDQETLLEIVLKRDNLSDFFDEINALEDVQSKIHIVLEEIRMNKIALEDRKVKLEDERDARYQLKSMQVLQRRSIENNQNQKESILKETQGQERIYQQNIAQRQKDIDNIRKQIFLLESVGLEMTLGEALQHALFATSRTGLRPAFLLAILKKESSWGYNVGKGTYHKDMSPPQHEAFFQICRELGLDPETTPVSAKPSYGWGGAMGPAQFLPKTWLGYKDEVGRITGHIPPSPWNIDDAFTAAGVKLAAAGANQRTYDAEHKAAMIYFAGSRWNSPVYQWYGDQVLELATVIQEQLDAISK